MLQTSSKPLIDRSRESGPALPFVLEQMLAKFLGRENLTLVYIQPTPSQLGVNRKERIITWLIPRQNFSPLNCGTTT